MKRGLVLGLLLWALATFVLRFAHAGLLPLGRTAVILALYGASFVAFFILIRQLVAPSAGAPKAGERLRAGVALFLPTLVLDALAAAFFPLAYPNFQAAAAGVFGGWMLVCCGGGLAGLVSKE